MTTPNNLPRRLPDAEAEIEMARSNVRGRLHNLAGKSRTFTAADVDHMHQLLDYFRDSRKEARTPEAKGRADATD